MTSSSSSSKYLNSKLFPIFTQIHLASSKSKATFDPSSTDTTTSPSAGDKSKKKTTFQDDIRSKKTAKELLNQEQLKELREHQERRATYGGNLGDVSREAAFYLPPIREELPSPDPSQELPPSIRTSNGSIPTSIQEEMKSKGFKSYSRSPDGRVSPLNLWCKHEFDLKTIKSEQRMRKSLDLEAIRRRRKSTRANLGRRKSVMQKIFGEAGTDRRFSEDLYPEPEDVHDDGADRETPTDGPTEETSRVIFYQVFIPFLIAGFDNVGAGMILDRVQHWTVFRNVPELFILVASFLGLKGNLEMTLAARLATMANMGQLDDKKQRWTIAYGNIALVQGQAIVVAFMASLIAIFVNYLKEPDFDVSDFLLLCATGLLTASVTGFAMANLMVGATVLARKIGVNPDNVSALIASIMGDISAITLLALSARFFYNVTHIAWISPLVILFYVSILPLCLMSARNNPFTKSIVGQGWIPIIVAMFISSAAGFIFDVAVGIFETIAVVQPIINGVGGNLVAVQASRISTYFHLRCPIGTLPEEYEGKHLLKSPQAAFFGKNPNVKTARLLLMMSIPIHLVYFTAIYFYKSGEIVLTFSYITFYLMVVVIQISLLLYFAHLLVPFLWRIKLDPDNAAVPALMAFADLLGSSLLTSAYFALSSFNDPNVKLHLTDSDSSLSLLFPPSPSDNITSEFFRELTSTTLSDIIS